MILDLFPSLGNGTSRFESPLTSSLPILSPINQENSPTCSLDSCISSQMVSLSSMICEMELKSGLSKDNPAKPLSTKSQLWKGLVPGISRSNRLNFTPIGFRSHMSNTESSYDLSSLADTSKSVCKNCGISDYQRKAWAQVVVPPADIPPSFHQCRFCPIPGGKFKAQATIPAFRCCIVSCRVQVVSKSITFTAIETEIIGGVLSSWSIGQYSIFWVLKLP